MFSPVKAESAPVIRDTNAENFFSLEVADETFDVGIDTRTGVNDNDYQVPFAFTGTISQLTVKLGPMQLTEDDKAKAAKAVIAAD